MSQQKTQPRLWTVRLGVDEDGYPDWASFEDEARREGVRLIDILYRIGGKCYIEAVREQGEGGQWHTTGFNVAWDSFVPGTRGPKPQPAPPEPREEGDDLTPVSNVVPIDHEEPAVAA